MRLGANLAMATLDQHRESLDPNATVAEALTGGHGDTVTVGGQSKHVVSYMKDFLFAPEQMRTPLGVLSGGERGRLMLARALAKSSNLLVLDEPTNDLDLETLDVLEEMLARLCGHRASDQPRSRFPRPRGQRGDRAGGRRPLDRICGRLFRHAGAARCGPDAARRPKPAATESKETKPAPARETKTWRGQRLSFHQKHALETLPQTIAALQAKMRALQARLDDPTSLRARPQGVRRDLRRARRRTDGACRGGGEMAGAGNPARGDRGALTPRVARLSAISVFHRAARHAQPQRRSRTTPAADSRRSAPPSRASRRPQTCRAAAAA